MLRIFKQIPTLLVWGFVIALARKTKRNGMVLCDVTSNQSKNGPRFVVGVASVLEELDQTLVDRARERIRFIARAEIAGDFEYYSIAKLLLLRINYDLTRNGQRHALRSTLNDAITSVVSEPLRR